MGLEVGTVLAVDEYDLSITNDVGGTSQMPPGAYRVRITREFNDYEVGERCVGELIDAADRRVAVAAGTTGHGPKEPGGHGDPRLDRLLREGWEKRDRQVYFLRRRFSPDPPGAS